MSADTPSPARTKAGDTPRKAADKSARTRALGDLKVPAQHIDQVAELIAEALPRKVGASRLGISQHTVDAHVTNIMHRRSESGRPAVVITRYYLRNAPSVKS